IPAGSRDELSSVKGLLITPNHLESCSGRFFPEQVIILIAFPRRRVASHEIEIERCWPAQSTAACLKKRFVSRRRNNGEIVAAIFRCGLKRPEREDLSSAGHSKLIVFGRTDAQSISWIGIVQA